LRSLTSLELRQKLKKLGAGERIATDLIHRAEQSGLIDERAIAEDHIRRGRESRLVGRFLLRYELAGRGLDKSLIEEVLEEMYPESEELSVTRRFAESKLKYLGGLPSEVKHRRVAGALDRRGFTAENVATVLRNLNLDAP